MKALIITNLFPNNMQPHLAMFHKQQFKELGRFCEVKVVAPLPFFKYPPSRVPEKEIIEGIEVYHPRYLVIPKILRSLYGFFFFLGVLNTVKQIQKDFQFDCILSLWAYPDGFGAFLVSKVLRRPIVIAALGSDINIHTRYFIRRKLISYAMKGSARVIAVSNDLKDKIIRIGVPEEKTKVIVNGVDTNLFKPMDEGSCRRRLSLPLDKKVILFVGNLEAVKGTDLLISSMEQLPRDISLIVIGDGGLRHILRRQARDSGLDGRVSFVGLRPHHEIPLWMNAADVFCLPSRNEGCPNVVLEALACGRPVVAARTGGIPELIKDKESGILFSAGDISGFSQAIKKALDKEWDREVLRKGALSRSWQGNAKEVFEALNG